MRLQSHGSPSCWNFGTQIYIGEGGGFPQVQAMVSLVSPKSPMAHPSTKGALESELTNLWLVGCRFE
jgi:hypothetical protein